MKRIEIYENSINIVFEITDENEAKLLHFSALPFDEAKTASYMGLKTFRPVEIQASGIDRPDERHGNKYIVTAPGWRMKFKDFRDVNNDHGRKLELVTFDEGTGLEAVSHVRKLPVPRTVLLYLPKQHRACFCVFKHTHWYVFLCRPVSNVCAGKYL